MTNQINYRKTKYRKSRDPNDLEIIKEKMKEYNDVVKLYNNFMSENRERLEKYKKYKQELHERTRRAVNMYNINEGAVFNVDRR